MADYGIYVLGEGDISISDGGVLDGVNQGDGSHLMSLKITLNTSNWSEVQISDPDDNNFADNDRNQRLNGDQVIDGTTYNDGTTVEAEYGITVTDGIDTWQLVGFNLRSGNGPAYSTIEGLAFVGDDGDFPPIGTELTVTSTQEGPSYAAINYTAPICFTTGTEIKTPSGPIMIEHLAVGDLVTTANGAPQPICWIGTRTVPAQGKFAPVRFATGALQNTAPLLVSPQHRMVLQNNTVQLLIGEDNALVAAQHLVGQPGVTRVTGGMVTYIHMLFDAHEIIFANGSPSESFHPGEYSLTTLSDATRHELFALFPQLETKPALYGPCVFPTLAKYEATLVSL